MTCTCLNVQAVAKCQTFLTKTTQQPTVHLQHNTVCYCYSAWREWAFNESTLFFTTLYTNHCGVRTGVCGSAFFFFFFKHMGNYLHQKSTSVHTHQIYLTAIVLFCLLAPPQHTHTHTVFTLSYSHIEKCTYVHTLYSLSPWPL